MITWYIGIDETGRFNPHSVNVSPSFVGAVVTKTATSSIHTLLENVYKDVKGKPCANDEELFSVFHGGANDDKEELNLLLKSLLHKENGTILHILKSEGQPAVVSSPQQWWTAAVLGVLKKFFESNIISRDDNVEIRIDQRKSTILGFVEEFNPEEKSEAIPANAVKDSLGEKEIYEAYLKALAQSIQQKLTKQYAANKIGVSFSSANGNALLTLADLVCNMEKEEFTQIIASEFGDDSEEFKKITPIKASPLNITLGENVENSIENGDVVHACELLLTQYFSGNKKILPLTHEIFKVAKGRTLTQVWNLIFTAIKNAFANRAFDGKSVEYAIALNKEISQYSSEISDESQKKTYLQVVSEIIAHSGSTSLEVFETIEQSFKSADPSFNTSIDRWNYYVFYKAMKAQALFNAYSFKELNFDDLKKTQEILDQVKFPFKTEGDLTKDENFAMIYGTLGQAAAFQGKLDEAIPLLEADYERASDKSKELPASYLTVVYHRKRDLPKAIEWFEKQCGMSFIEFSEKITPATSQWFTVNYFRIIALGADLGEKVPSIPQKNEWKNQGTYPWPLLQKWAAFIKYKQNTEESIHEANCLLRASANTLQKDPGFTVKTLALPVIAIQIVIAKELKKEKELEAFVRGYQTLLSQCMQMSPSFADYVNAHECFKKACSGELSLWEAATLLPFNYS